MEKEVLCIEKERVEALIKKHPEWEGGLKELFPSLKEEYEEVERDFWKNPLKYIKAAWPDGNDSINEYGVQYDKRLKNLINLSSSQPHTNLSHLIEVLKEALNKYNIKYPIG